MKTKILIAIIVGVLLLGGGFGIYQYNAAQAKKQALIAEEQAKQKKRARGCLPTRWTDTKNLCVASFDFWFNYYRL